jgi:hypothetical protein
MNRPISSMKTKVITNIKCCYIRRRGWGIVFSLVQKSDYLDLTSFPLHIIVPRSSMH